MARLKAPFVAAGAVLATALAAQVVSSDSWAPVERALRDLTPLGLLIQIYSASATLLGMASLVGTYRASHDAETRRRINVIGLGHRDQPDAVPMERSGCWMSPGGSVRGRSMRSSRRLCGR